MENLPIDIHSTKLLDWLLSRRHCGKDWQEAAYKIREKINHAIQDMPENPEIVNLLSGTYINYFHCLRIVEILKETEADTKNIFGFYSSQRMKDWNEVIKMYEKDNVYLAEAAQILQRMVQYEIPGVKKQITKCQNIQEDCDKKEVEYTKQSKEAERQFQAECTKMGISAVEAELGSAKIREELLQLADNLPEFLACVQNEVENLKEPVDYYVRFRQHVLSRSEPENHLVSMVKYLLEKGNTTYFEWISGRKPEKIEPLVLMQQAEEIVEDQIDFGTEDIDFGSLEGVDLGEMAITVVDDLQVVEDSIVPSQDDSVAHGQDAFTVLEHQKTQNLLLQDLMELEAFLKCRSMDLTTEHPSDFLLASQQSRDSVGGAEVMSAVMKGNKEVQGYLNQVQKILMQLQDPYKKYLMKIRGSTRYLETLTEELEQKRCQSKKYLRLRELIEEKRGEAVKEASQLGPKLELLVKRTKELQKQIEGDISKRYKGRVVNIMGGITAVI